MEQQIITVITRTKMENLTTTTTTTMITVVVIAAYGVVDVL
jgi:hypothetical protein